VVPCKPGAVAHTVVILAFENQFPWCGGDHIEGGKE
jgi:hypothetical protein